MHQVASALVLVAYLLAMGPVKRPAPSVEDEELFRKAGSKERDRWKVLFSSSPLHSCSDAWSAFFASLTLFAELLRERLIWLTGFIVRCMRHMKDFQQVPLASMPLWHQGP